MIFGFKVRWFLFLIFHVHWINCLSFNFRSNAPSKNRRTAGRFPSLSRRKTFLLLSHEMQTVGPSERGSGHNHRLPSTQKTKQFRCCYINLIWQQSNAKFQPIYFSFFNRQKVQRDTLYGLFEILGAGEDRTWRTRGGGGWGLLQSVVFGCDWEGVAAYFDGGGDDTVQIEREAHPIYLQACLGWEIFICGSKVIRFKICSLPLPKFSRNEGLGICS